MAEKAIHLGGEATADAIVSAVDTMYSEHTFNEKDFALKHNDAEIAMDSNFAAQSFWKDVRVPSLLWDGSCCSWSRAMHFDRKEG